MKAKFNERLFSLEKELLSQDYLKFLEYLQNKFDHKRKELFERRQNEQKLLCQGSVFEFRKETEKIRDATWQVAKVPKDLEDRKVEITGPPDRKMMIHAMNSGAAVFMADLEDACSPHWKNILEGHKNLQDLVRRQIDFKAKNGKEYKLKERTATLIVRPRGWHLNENHLKLSTHLVSASLFDFSLYLFHAHKKLKENGSGVYFYLPKLENYLEARLWAEVIEAARQYLGINRDLIKTTVLIETIGAAFDIEEILYELKDTIVGMNAGRWDYIFSIIKKFHFSPNFILPDREQVTMKASFMRAYCDFLVDLCHKRGAHAIGGMSAFIPSRKHQEITDKALLSVKEDKELEAQNGFDGTWVAHPDLVPLAKEVFSQYLGENPHQKDFRKSMSHLSAKSLLKTNISNSTITKEGLKKNIRVALEYIQKWLGGQGAVAINHMMEDAATAEISRAQIWQWLHHKVTFEDGQKMAKSIYEASKLEELNNLRQSSSQNKLDYSDATKLLDDLVFQESFVEFLTLPASEILAAYEN